MSRRTVAACGLAALAALGLTACTDDAPRPASDVGVQLFQWTWDAVAAECPALADAGYGWVLISPATEHVLGEQWWTAYQPVSYLLESRLGTRAELEAMVGACHDAGVQVVADAVINHMTGSDGGGTGWAGSPFEHYSYPGLWTEDDFHRCDTPDGDIGSYSDPQEVRTCELVNLADLATGTPAVRERLTAYLADLLAVGVDGFRIDAAKHMAVEDVAAILDPLPPQTLVLQEVIHGAGEPIRPEHYLDNGMLFDFEYAGQVLDAVVSGHVEDLLEPRVSGLPAESSVLFVANHDTERNGSTLSYRTPEAFELGTVLMLATAADGTPMVYSGYAFSARDAGPGKDADGAVLDAVCEPDAGPQAEPEDGAWVCQHRWPAVSAMVGWRMAVGEAPVTETWSDDRAVAWSRGERGFLAASGGPELTVALRTTLPPGVYCDVLTGGAVDGRCTGTPVEVADDGSLTVTIPEQGAVALHADARPDAAGATAGGGG